jgi:rhodanese-related sulfurtransferase
MRATIFLLTLLSFAGHALADDALPSATALVAEAKAQIKEISAAELKAGALDGRVVIDVREPEEFAGGHIPGAVNQPRGTLEFTVMRHPVLAALAEQNPARVADTQIILYCRSGTRSALAAQTLEKMGFNNVYSLRGGFQGWQETPATPTP